MTLAGLRRRGVTPTAINDFVRGIGITRRLVSYYSISVHSCMKNVNFVLYSLNKCIDGTFYAVITV